MNFVTQQNYKMSHKKFVLFSSNKFQENIDPVLVLLIDAIYSVRSPKNIHEKFANVAYSGICPLKNTFGTLFY